MKTFDSLKDMPVTCDRCFLCGCQVFGKNSEEHVFPKWLQKRYQLWDQRITLLNRTQLPYRRLTIACCQHCNTTHLAALEKRVQEAHDGGFERFRTLDEMTVYQWLVKLQFGLLFKEASLLMDRANPGDGTIVPSGLLKNLATLHFFLQSVRRPYEFNGTPWSIFVVRTLPVGGKGDFDYYDDLMTLTFAIRLGEVGIIACLQDNGAQGEFGSAYFEKLSCIALHPVQFSELYAKVLYRANLLNRTPKYVGVAPDENAGEKDPVTVMCLPLQGFSTSPIFDDWDQEAYAGFLGYCIARYGLPIERLFEPPDKVWTSLTDGNGMLTQLDSRGRIIRLFPNEGVSATE